MERNRELAADWLQRLDDGALKEEDLQSWLEWFAASAQNRKAFEEMQTVRRRFRTLPAEFRTELPMRLGVNATPIPSPGRRGRARVGASLLLAASLATLVLGVLVWWKTHSPDRESVYAASADQHRTIPLEDGSAVVLAASAAVAVDYSFDRRSLNIERGAAYFEVRPDPKRPFVVHAGEVVVTALGTTFNIERGSNAVKVTVTEGLVTVGRKASGSAALRLAVGQQVVVPLDGHRAAPASQSSTQDRNWRDGRADFIDAPLSQVLEVINPYAPARLVIDDPRVADLTYSGTILREHIDEWIASLPHVYAIRAVPLEDGTVTLVSRHE